ncbi:hypothetical protein M9458_051701 [Cirrhinus mrigala]|uniref:Uncharacterized protein n=1 Tax=Cirrhinus mrigala TaxID=683832 RepID=A0ABD0MW06_CIRMR
MYLSAAVYVPVSRCLNLPALTMFLSRPLNKSMHMDPLASRLSFLDYALLCLGLSFTVGVAEEQRDKAVTPAAHPARKMAATAEPVLKMVAKTKLRHVTAAMSEPSKVAAAFPESSQVSESSQVAAAFPESSQLSESSQGAAVFPVSSKATAVSLKSSKVTAVFPESSKVSPERPEPLHKMAATPEPVAKMAASQASAR